LVGWSLVGYIHELNAAARLVVGVGRYEHITPALHDVLHWLPVPQRIQFKIAISAFDCVREPCPAYFNNVCIPVAAFLVGQLFVRQNATTCLSLRQEHSSADGVSMLHPQPSGMRLHQIKSNCTFIRRLLKSDFSQVPPTSMRAQTRQFSTIA